MCGPRIKSQAPAASTTPTMQAAEELELVTDGLQDNAIGRAALRTSGGGARKPASATTAAAAASGTSVPSSAPSGASETLDLAVNPQGGRRTGSRQPFYNPEGSTQ